MHKEGTPTIILFTLLFLGSVVLMYSYQNIWSALALITASVLLGLILWFFRNPDRSIAKTSDQIIYAPADGKIVVIEKTIESEYYKDERVQVSIFMSPLNVHVNRAPINGEVKYTKYHSGKYLTAWHPKSSTENERSTMVIENKDVSLLLRQIAGAMARRIVTYAKPGTTYRQGEDYGFIKFGSRVDIFLPLDAQVNVNLQDKVLGNRTIIATIKS